MNRGSFALLLLVLVALLIDVGLQTRRCLIPAPDVEREDLELDSFSELSVAAAVLKKHGQDLQSAYGVSRQAFVSGEVGNKAAPPFPTGRWIRQYQEEIRRIKEAVAVDALQHDLLLLCYEKGTGEEFLDVYLDILEEAPDHPDAECWALWALWRSERCGRTEEVLDALQHHARFHRGPKQAAWSQAALDQWAEESRRSGGAPEP